MRNYVIAAGSALLIALLVVCSGLFTSISERRQTEANLQSQYEPIVKKEDAKGVETASKPLQVNSAKAVGRQETKLGKAVRKVGTGTKTATVVAVETIGIVDASPPDPASKSILAFNDEWINASIDLQKEHPTLDYRVRNELEIFQVSRSNGIFKPTTLEVMVRNLNPHSTVTDLQSFSVEVPRRRTGVWLGLGFIAGAATTVYLLN
ncbi:hypothetical protein GU926_08155 [Nibribacter ruber]|uniref:Uncharacterized protein n=1 Tax=Nibribacter ruber TaxID=2698458 RepID=A0A6P1NZJ1_9BACT|nr:hypothetical protein [Nibribacter ruber]QHL87408.1 hypothetical protein GU926_08155 [Nibribacter ruber]